MELMLHWLSILDEYVEYRFVRCGKTHYRRFSMLKIDWSFVRNHLSMFVICQIFSTLYPRWKAVAIAKMRLSVGFSSSSSMSSTKSF